MKTRRLTLFLASLALALACQPAAANPLITRALKFLVAAGIEAAIQISLEEAYDSYKKKKSASRAPACEEMPTNKTLTTPLAWAVSVGYTEGVICLLENGVNPNSRNSDDAIRYKGASMLYLAARGDYAKNIEVVSLLLAAGADVNARGWADFTPLMGASMSKTTYSTEITRLLLQSGAKVNAMDDDGRTALMLAVDSGSMGKVQLLLEHGANANAATNDGETPLIEAAYLGKIGVARLLIEHGADVNAANKNGITALFLAEKKGYTEIVRMLRAAGARE